MDACFVCLKFEDTQYGLCVSPDSVAIRHEVKFVDPKNFCWIIYSYIRSTPSTRAVIFLVSVFSGVTKKCTVLEIENPDNYTTEKYSSAGDLMQNYKNDPSILRGIHSLKAIKDSLQDDYLISFEVDDVLEQIKSGISCDYNVKYNATGSASLITLENGTYIFVLGGLRYVKFFKDESSLNAFKNKFKYSLDHCRILHGC